MNSCRDYRTPVRIPLTPLVVSDSEREKEKKITDLHRRIKLLEDELIYAWAKVDKLEEAVIGR